MNNPIEAWGSRSGPLLFLSHNPQFSPLDEVAGLCRQYGCGLEMSAFSDQAVVFDDSQVEFHRRGATGINRRSVHGPYLDLYPGHPDPEIRRRTLHCFRRVYAGARSLGAPDLIFHHTYDPRTITEEVWLDNSTSFWKDFLDRAPDCRVHLENILDETPALLVKLLESVDRPRLDIALDLGHAYCYSRTPLVDWIKPLGQRIGYVHLHDNHGQEDEHLGLGEGNLPLPETLELLRRYCPTAIWSIEAGGERMYRSLDWLRRHGYLR